jgi:hypothetical protein
MPIPLIRCLWYILWKGPLCKNSANNTVFYCILLDIPHFTRYNPFYTMTTFLTYFMDSKRSKCGSGILEFHFFCFSKFWLRTRYVWFSIFVCLNVAFLFLNLSLCYFFLNNALGLLNPNLFKLLKYLYPFLRYLKRAYFFLTVHTFKTMNLCSTYLAIKFDLDEIETLCFLLLKAEIHAILDQKL